MQPRMGTMEQSIQRNFQLVTARGTHHGYAFARSDTPWVRQFALENDACSDGYGPTCHQNAQQYDTSLMLRSAGEPEEKRASGELG